MARPPFKPFALFLVLALAGFGSAISPAEALDRVKPLLGDAVKDVATLEQPLEYGDNRYYLFYFPITSSNRLLIAVDELDGVLVTDEAQLTELGARTYRLEVARRVLKAQGLGYVDLDSFGKSTKRSVDATRASYDTVVKGQLEPRYPSISFKILEQRLDAVTASVDALQQLAIDGLALERAFEGSYNSIDLDAYLASYNRTLAGLAEYFRAAEAYQAAVREKANEAANSRTLKLEQKQEINNALQQVFNVGAWEEYSRTYTTAKEEYDRRLSRQTEWVNSSIQAFLYEKAKYDAEEAYKVQEGKVRELLAIEFDLRACALEREAAELKSAWTQVEALRLRKELASYREILAKMPRVSELIASLEDKYKRCVQGATPTPKPKQTGPDTTVLVAVAVIAIGGFLYWQYRKRKMAEEEGQ